LFFTLFIYIYICTWYSFEQGPGLEDAVEEALEKARGELKGMAVREEEAMETSKVEQNNKEETGKKASDDGSGCSRGEEWGDVEEVVGKDVEYVRSKEGRLFVVGKGVGGLVEGEKVQLDEWLGERGEEEVVIVEDEMDVSGSGRGGESVLNVSVRSCEGGDMFSFLDNIDNVGSDEVAEKRRGEDQKRKRDVGGFVVNSRGLLGTPGWEDRESKEKGDSRWKREVVVGGEVKLEDMPLPEEYRLGLEKRGEEMNNSSRSRNNMGTNRKALFPKGGLERGEEKNWLASFTRVGCIGCRDERGVLNHRGRKGEPLVVVIGDEATPSAVGYTRGPEEEQGCSWILKKEHLRLGEVAGMLRRLNNDKQESDKESGRKLHEFFIPNGSKIIVGSYVHLRKEGLEGYMADFTAMVKDIWAVTGDIGVEVLPFCPVAFEGIDKEGGLLLSGLRDWIRWLGGITGRKEVEVLSTTGGREVKEEGEGESVTWIYRPVGAVLRSQRKGSSEIGLRGNVVTVVRGGAREVTLREAMPSKEITRMMNKGGLGGGRGG